MKTKHAAYDEALLLGDTVIGLNMDECSSAARSVHGQILKSAIGVAGKLVEIEGLRREEERKKLLLKTKSELCECLPRIHVLGFTGVLNTRQENSLAKLVTGLLGKVEGMLANTMSYARPAKT